MIPFAVILFGLLALFMAAGGIPLADDAQLAVFRTPVFRLLCALTAIASLAACARYGRSLRRLPFWLAHLGAVVILFGAALGSALAVRGRLVLPVAARHAVDTLPTEDAPAATPLGFRLSVADFKVEHYPPTYHLYRPTVPYPQRADDYEHVAELAVPAEGELRHAAFGELDRARLLVPAREAWIEQLALPGGLVLQRGRLRPRVFEAVLATRQGAAEARHELRVNHPVTVNGWRIYLESYGLQPQHYVQLQLRRDPGRSYVIGGIWMVMVGAALLCWRPRRV